MTTEPTADPPAPPRRPTFTERLGTPRGTRGFVARLEAGSAADMYLIRGVDQGKPAWYYFRTDRGKKTAFEKALRAANGGTVPLTEYGTILDRGWGRSPPPDVVARMSAEYGFTEAASAESDD